MQENIGKKTCKTQVANGIPKVFLFKGGGGGVQGLKSWKHYFEITGDPKGPPSGSTF